MFLQSLHLFSGCPNSRFAPSNLRMSILKCEVWMHFWWLGSTNVIIPRKHELWKTWSNVTQLFLINLLFCRHSRHKISLTHSPRELLYVINWPPIKLLVKWRKFAKNMIKYFLRSAKTRKEQIVLFKRWRDLKIIFYLLNTLFFYYKFIGCTFVKLCMCGTIFQIELGLSHLSRSK